MKYTGERYIPEISGQIELEHYNRYFFVANQINLADKIVVDLASGEGYGSNILAKYARQVFGIDISLEAIEHARQKYQRNNLSYLQGEATRIPIESNSIDVFVCFETIEHHDKHEDMLAEIKRILKPNGILVISSPDKQFYSEIPNYKNVYHVKELYYEEFKKLLNRYFTKCIFYAQKIFSGSIITLDEDDHKYVKPIIINKDGNKNKFDPVYNISICTDDKTFKPAYQQILYQTVDYFLEQKDINDVIKKLKESRPYKIGNYILKPLRFIKRLIKSI